MVSICHAPLALHRVKKILVIFLLLFYGSSSLGMTLHFHYCCGQLQKIDLVAKSHCNHETENTAPKSCCIDEELSLRIDDEQRSVTTFINFYPKEVAPSLEIPHTTLLTRGQTVFLPVFNPHPFKEFIELYCVYRI